MIKRKRIIPVLFALLLVTHLVISMTGITRWWGQYAHIIMSNYHVPVERRLFTMSGPEYRHILYINEQLREDDNILWLPQADPIINYYMFPRRMYRIGEFNPDDQVSIDPAFLKERHITHIFVDFGKLRPVMFADEGTVDESHTGGAQ